MVLAAQVSYLKCWIDFLFTGVILKAETWLGVPLDADSPFAFLGFIIIIIILVVWNLSLSLPQPTGPCRRIFTP